MKIELKSAAFAEGGMIPKDYTCDGKDISPPLAWAEVPKGTRSIALICDDPDAPMGTFVHWLVYNLPPGTRELPENTPHKIELDNGALQGTNDFKRTGYAGPCPPGKSVHRFFFKLYALDEKLKLDPGVKKPWLVKAMEGHILAEGTLIGRYGR